MNCRAIALHLLLPAVVAGSCALVATGQQASGSASAALGASQPQTHGSPPGYVGDAACSECHREQSITYTHTAHALTSRLPSRDTILGSFAAGANTLSTINPALHYEMQASDKRFFESAIEGLPPKTTSHTEPIDLVIGSGRKGQTYLYWSGDKLFELPVSYWVSLREWVNSPGYEDGYADFNRGVIPRCLECHATYFEALGASFGNEYKKDNFVLGISCEKCHGPGAEHLNKYRGRSAVAETGTAIVNPAKLARERQMDICALCHGGAGKESAPAFAFRPGQQLADYVELPRFAGGAHIDVHGSQVELLKRSRCYQESSSMTCSTCHNVHQPQRDAAEFSSHCLSCHEVKSCGVFAKMGARIAGKCIDCHMPEEQSNAIISSSSGVAVKPEVRSHWIKVYPQGDTGKSKAGP